MGDFNQWLPKLSSRGIVMFHDIAVHRDDFGVWRTWQELSSQYPNMSFDHSYGLGILFVGAEIPDAAKALLERWQHPDFADMLRTLARVAGQVCRAENERSFASRINATPYTAHIEPSIPISNIERAAEAFVRELADIRDVVGEMDETRRKIRGSKLWPVIRMARPLLKRFKRMEQLTLQMQTIISSQKTAVGDAKSAEEHKRQEIH